MNYRCFLASLISLCFVAGSASAQSQASATRGIAPTVFVLATGTATGVGGYQTTALFGSKNLGVTAGLDLDVYSFGSYRLGAEVRGTYPISSGTIVGERELLAGVRITHEPSAEHGIRPYADAHFGRGQMNYPRGYQVGNLLYQQTASNVYGGGGGVEVDMTKQFSLKVDAQAHHWSTPVVVGNSVWAGQLSVGVAYRIFAGAGPR